MTILHRHPGGWWSTVDQQQSPPHLVIPPTPAYKSTEVRDLVWRGQAQILQRGKDNLPTLVNLLD